MYLEAEEQTRTWQAVQVGWRTKTDEKFRELDKHFAHVQSWHEVLNGDQDSRQTLPPPTDPIIGDGRSEIDNAEYLGDIVDILTTQIECERKEHDYLTQQWAGEKAKTLAELQQLADREKELEARLQSARDERDELGLAWSELVDKQQRLDERCEQLARDAAEHKSVADEWEAKLNRERESFQIIEQQLEEETRRREDAVRSMEEARDELAELQTARTFEKVESEQPEPEHGEVDRPLEKTIDLDSRPSEIGAACGSQAMLEGGSREFEHISMDQIAENEAEDDEFDRLVDRLVDFHLTKTKKWFMFWR